MKRLLKGLVAVSALAILLAVFSLIVSPSEEVAKAYLPPCDVCTSTSSCDMPCWEGPFLITCGEWGVCAPTPTPTPTRTPTPTPTPRCEPDKVYFQGRSGMFLDFWAEYFNNLPNVGYRQIAFANAKAKFENVYGSGSWNRACDRTVYPNGCRYAKYQAYTYEWFCTVSARPPR